MFVALKALSVDGNRQFLDGGSMFGNAPRAVWEKWTPPDALGRIELACRALFIEVDGVNVLCETGIGSFFDPKLADRFGVQDYGRHCLRENLETVGIGEDQVDFVILSHLHFDHAGGLLPTYSEIQNGKSELLFPKAKYLVGQEALERAKKPHSRDRASFIPGLVEKLESSGRMVVVQGDTCPLLPESFRFFYSHGHTPGQMLTHFQRNEFSIFFAGDLIPGSHWVHLPITMGYDRFPELVIDEKRQVLDQLLDDQSIIFFTHDSEFAASRISRDEKGRYRPINCVENLGGVE